MTTSEPIVPIISGNVRFFCFFHKYTNVTNSLDRLLVLLEDNNIVFVEIDPISYSITNRRKIHYKSKMLLALNSDETTNITCSSFELISLSLYGVEFTDYQVIFAYFENVNTGQKFVMQINSDDLFRSLEIVSLAGCFEEDEEFLSAFVNRNIVFTDNKRIDMDEVYLVYRKQHENKEGDIRAKSVAITDEQKQELRDKVPIYIPPTKYPIVDRWTNLDVLLSKIPKDTIDTRAFFSTGLTFLRFGSN